MKLTLVALLAFALGSGMTAVAATPSCKFSRAAPTREPTADSRMRGRRWAIRRPRHPCDFDARKVDQAQRDHELPGRSASRLGSTCGGLGISLHQPQAERFCLDRLRRKSEDRAPPSLSCPGSAAAPPVPGGREPDNQGGGLGRVRSGRARGPGHAEAVSTLSAMAERATSAACRRIDYGVAQPDVRGVDTTT